MINARPIGCLVLTLLLAACAKEPATSPTTAQSAPAAAPAVVDVFDFTVGPLTATALRDGGLTVANDGKTIAINTPTDQVAKVLRDAGLPETELSLSIQPLLVRSGDRVMLFDTGAGTLMGPGAGKLSKALDAAGVARPSVTDIFISHAHGDHIGGLLDADGKQAFTNATVHLSEAEWTYLRGLKEQAALVAVITPWVVTFKPGSDILPGLVKAVDVKGHTPGHSAYLIGSGADTLLYLGDTVHHSVISVQQPDWTIAFDGDAPTAQASRKELLARSAASGQRIYAVHFPFPGLGKFVKQGDHEVWTPEAPAH